MDRYAGNSSRQVLSGNERDGENIALATAVHASVLNKIQTLDRGIKRARWAVLTHIKKPAILFEGGFVTHPVESREISSDAYQVTVADALARAVSNFRRAVSG